MRLASPPPYSLAPHLQPIAPHTSAPEWPARLRIRLIFEVPSRNRLLNVGAEYWNIETEYWNKEIEHPNIRMIEPNRCMNVLSNSVLKRPDADRWTLIYLPSPPCTLHTSHTTNTALFIYFPVTTHRVPLLVINNKTALFVWSFRWWPTSGRPKPVPVLCINSRSHILIKYSIFWIRIHLMCLLTQ